MSQFPPCSRPGTVRAASLPAASPAAPDICPMSAVVVPAMPSGRVHSGGTRSGSVLKSSCSRLFHFASRSAEGRVPIRPGWIRPGKRTPGMWRDVV